MRPTACPRPGPGINLTAGARRRHIMHKRKTPDAPPHTLSRREAMRAAAAAAAGAAAFSVVAAGASAETSPNPGAPVIKNGRVNQSIVHWCFQYNDKSWDVERS